VIDVGGIAEHWSDDERVVTVLNLMRQEAGRHQVLIGDGRHVHCVDHAFDLAYCNSVIEHVGSSEDQEALARELRRIAPALFVQTPNRWFPLEVHYLTLFLHWWPGLLRQPFVARWFTGWGWLARPNRAQIEEYAASIRLLSAAQMKKLFPDCELRRERFLGFTKSLISIRGMR
jgi:hypothetical protein